MLVSNTPQHLFFFEHPALRASFPGFVYTPTFSSFKQRQATCALVPPLGSPVRFVTRSVSSSSTETPTIGNRNSSSSRGSVPAIRVSERRPIAFFVQPKQVSQPKPAVPKPEPVETNPSISRVCRMKPAELDAFVESRRREISDHDRQLVRELAIRELADSRMSLDELVNRKLREFENLAAAGGKLWDQHFKAEWLKGASKTTQPATRKQNDDPNVVRFF